MRQVNTAAYQNKPQLLIGCFDKSSRFSSYAALIGLDAEAMRKALLTPIDEITFEPKQSKFDKSKRRILRAAHAKWLERKMAEKETLKRLNS